MKPGDLVDVLSKAAYDRLLALHSLVTLCSTGWWFGRIGARTGDFPSNYVVRASPSLQPHAEMRRNPTSRPLLTNPDLLPLSFPCLLLRKAAEIAWARSAPARCSGAPNRVRYSHHAQPDRHSPASYFSACRAEGAEL